jgi:Zn-dependent metalloprotease
MGPAAIKQGYTCLRDMANPAATHCLAPQPTKYSQYKPGMDPHLSSGVPNLAFCTIAKAVGGNSWDKVGQIWYKSMTGFGPTPAMKMKAFANRTRSVAGQLYPGDASLAGAVDAGWKTVGL